IDADRKRGAVARDHVEKPAHSASALEHELAGDVGGLQTGFLAKAALRVGETAVVELDTRERPPLEPERLGIGLAVDEPDHAVTLICRVAFGAFERGSGVPQFAAVVRASENAQGQRIVRARDRPRRQLFGHSVISSGIYTAERKVT